MTRCEKGLFPFPSAKLRIFPYKIDREIPICTYNVPLNNVKERCLTHLELLNKITNRYASVTRPHRHSTITAIFPLFQKRLPLPKNCKSIHEQANPRPHHQDCDCNPHNHRWSTRRFRQRPCLPTSRNHLIIITISPWKIYPKFLMLS